MNTISCIIPTLWIANEIHQLCDYLNSSQLITEVIIIDNDTNKRSVNYQKYGENSKLPSIEYNEILYNVECYGKFKILVPLHNVFVTESWNVGVSISIGDTICILNDDIIINDQIINDALHTLTPDVGIIGLNKQCFVNSEHTNTIELATVRPEGFGCCMIMKKSKYNIIPSILRIWCNDDYLFETVEGTHYTFIGAKVTGGISKSVNNPKIRLDIQKIIKEDLRNYHLIKARIISKKLLNQL